MGKPPDTTPFPCQQRSRLTCGFGIALEAARDQSFAVVASGLRVMLRLSFRNGDSAQSGTRITAGSSFGTKTKTQCPEFEKKFLRLSQLLSTKPTKRDIASFGGTRSVSMPKTGCNWNDGTTEPKPSSGNKTPRQLSIDLSGALRRGAPDLPPACSKIAKRETR